MAPRIVKLHGSFPVPPFIITEADYGCYETGFGAIFANLARQVLVENTLCLVGFSGNDPNFRSWLVWIHRHLPQSSAQTVYLVNVSDDFGRDVTSPLAAPGISSIDLSGFGDPKATLRWFLKELKDRKPRIEDWPIVSRKAREWASHSDTSKYRAIVKEWRRQRENYPGWVVLPVDRRDILWSHTENWFAHLAELSETEWEALKTPLDLDLVFELVWRLDLCLLPLDDRLRPFLEQVARKYSGSMQELPAASGWTPESVFGAVSTIRLWLLRHYREEGLGKEWSATHDALRFGIERLTSEQRYELRMEEALEALFRFRPDEARRLLADWPDDLPRLPLWEAKRAVLLAELGEYESTSSNLELSLSTIRRQVNFDALGQADPLALPSQLAVVMLLYQMVKPTGFWKDSGPGEGIRLQDEISECRENLKRLNCDPRPALESLSDRLRRPFEGRNPLKVSTTFDSGVVDRRFSPAGTGGEALSAYKLLRMYEDIGIGRLAFDSGAITGALVRMNIWAPHWALVTLVRTGDPGAVDSLFNRERLAGLKQVEVDKYCEDYLPSFEHMVDVLETDTSPAVMAFEPIAKTLPEVFSRLCCKCSPQYRERMLGALGKIYGLSPNRRPMFRRNVVQRFMQRLFDSMSAEELARAVPALVDLPVPDEFEGAFERRSFVNPLLLLERRIQSMRAAAPRLKPERINSLLDRMARCDHDRDWVAASLTWVHDIGQLDDRQSERFGTLLWDGVETRDVPIVDGLRSFACMLLPHPPDIEPGPRVKKRVRPAFSDIGRTIPDRSMDELRYSASQVRWTREEAMELIAEPSAWWDKNKHWLGDNTPMPFGSHAERTKQSIDSIVGALSEVFAHLSADSDADNRADALWAFLADLEKHDVPALRLRAAALTIAPENHQRVFDRVKIALLHTERDIVMDALSAIRILAHLLPEDGRDGFGDIVALLVQGIQWRVRPFLDQRLRCAGDLFGEQPWFLSAVAEAGLLAGLSHIARETEQDRIKGNDEDGMVPIRTGAAALACVLAKRYRNLGMDEPEEIQHWRKVCGHPDEFAEVRNGWMDGWMDRFLEVPGSFFPIDPGPKHRPRVLSV